MRRFLSLAWPLLMIGFLCSSSPAFAADEGKNAMHDPHGPSPLELRYDTAIWTVVIFVFLLVILQRTAWKPILEGLQKREETIRSSLEEAKTTRADMERMRQDFQKQLAEAHQQIPRLMEEARKNAEQMKAEMIAATSKQLESERERLYRDVERAKSQALQEIWEQATQLATLISAKVIGRSLGAEDHHRLLDESLREMRQTSNN